MKKLIFILSILIFTSCAQEVSLFTAHHNQRIEELKADRRTYSVVFLGDSLTEMGDFESVIPDSKNAGIGGDTIELTADAVACAVNYKPEKIFLLVGINSLLRYPYFDCIAQYNKLIDLLTQSFPDTEIILESVLPHAQGYEVIKLFNEYVKQTAEEKGFKYLDLYSLYAVDDKLPLELTEDGLHLKKEAYSVWYEAIRKEL